MSAAARGVGLVQAAAEGVPQARKCALAEDAWGARKGREATRRVVERSEAVRVERVRSGAAGEEQPRRLCVSLPAEER